MSDVRRGRAQSLETRMKRSKSSLGEKSGGWIDGRTKQSVLIRESLEYRLWRESVFKRDDYTCRFCRARSSKGSNVVLNADHIKPFAYYPELRFAIDNGRTLCVDCHKNTDTYLGKVRRIHS